MSFINKYLVYYINLDSELERDKHTISQLNQTVLANKYERHSATDGRFLDISLIHNDIITDQARSDIVSKKQRTFGVSLTYGSLACAISHKQLWIRCIEKNKPILIFEDDIIINKDFDTMLQLVDDQISNINYDIMYLGYNEIPGFRKERINDVLSKPSGLITGLYAYIISPIGAKKMLNILFPMNKQIDSCISDNISKFNLFCYKNSAVNPNLNFLSRTQRSTGCMNLLGEDNWHKLFI